MPKVGCPSIKDLEARVISFIDFWSEVVEEVQLGATASDVAITGGNVVVVLPTGVTITRAMALFKFRAVENTHATLANEIEATTQDIEVKESVAGTFTDAIDITQGAFKIAAATREGGDVLIGDIDVKAEVDGDGTYAFQWNDAESTRDNLNFNDVQVGLRVYFRS